MCGLMRFLPCLLLALCWFTTVHVHAHVVPNMTIEAEFTQDHRYTLRINLDPRVFLSDQPTSLPPVTADWYLSQSDSQKQETYTKATEYLEENVGLGFGEQTLKVPACEFVALDGATNEPVKPDTAETHLLATAKGEVPAGSDSFKVVFGKAANVSLILLNSEEGSNDKRPQVIFPGETSRPFKISKAPAAQPKDPLPEGIKITDVSVQQGVMIGGSFVSVRSLLIGVVATLGFVGVLFVILKLMLKPKRKP